MDIDPTKAPRTYAAWKKAYDVVELVKFMVELSQQLECELNGSNKIIRQQQLLDEKNLMLMERIKRLEEAGQELLFDNDNMANIYRWHKAKEAKL
jgi:hypothetical protein